MSGSASAVATNHRTGFWFMVLACAPLLAQDVPRGTLSGRVVDDDTGAPIPFVNIFIANSSLGSTSGDDGKFEIKNIPAGDHEVVVSIVGYQRKSQRMQFLGKPQVIDFRLKPALVEIPGVNIVAEYPLEWKENLEKFTQEFLGYSPLAKKCRIVNPEVLDFTRTDHWNMTAAARQPLTIENPRLGYMLEYHLHEFSIQDRNLRFSGVARFQETKEENNEEKGEWERARKKAYRGSLQHFLSVLAQGRTLEEGFEMHQAYSVTYAPQWGARVVPDSIIHPTIRSYEKTLSFPGLIEITYKRERTDPEYWDFLSSKGIQVSERREGAGQTSWISLNTPVVLVNTLGVLSNPYALTTFGYWSYERMGEVTPLDYTPPVD